MCWTLLNTRPKHQAWLLTELAQQCGFSALECPSLEIVLQPPQDLDLAEFEVVVFVSRNAVQALALSRPNWSGQQLVAVGAATAQAMDALNWPNRQPLPPSFDSEGMLQLAAFAAPKNRRVLIVRGDGGRELLADSLRQAGAQVTISEVYRREVAPFCNQVWLLFKQAEKPILLFTSQASLAAFLTQLPSSDQAWCLSLPMIVFSHRIKQFAQAQGFNAAQIYVTDESSDAAVIRCLQHIKD